MHWSLRNTLDYCFVYATPFATLIMAWHDDALTCVQYSRNTWLTLPVPSAHTLGKIWQMWNLVSNKCSQIKRICIINYGNRMALICSYVIAEICHFIPTTRLKGSHCSNSVTHQIRYILCNFLREYLSKPICLRRKPDFLLPRFINFKRIARGWFPA